MYNQKRNGLKKGFIFILLFLIFLNVINAEESGGVLMGKQNECISLPQECPSCSYSILTKVVYPRLSFEYYNKTMTQFGTSYNITFCNTSDIGEYSYCTLVDVDGIDTIACKEFFITPAGKFFDLKDVIFYLFFFLLCAGMMVYSFKLIKDNPPSEDNVINYQMYKLKQRHELMFYLKILKSKLYIIGSFGVYLSILLFSSFLFQLTHNLGLSEISSILSPITIILSWGLIPFVLFWGAYFIIVFVKASKDILQYQFGGIDRLRE
jgi:hypothetical protein